MNILLKLQLKKIYGEEYETLIQENSKFKDFLNLVDEAYRDYEQEEALLENVLNINAQELEATNALLQQQQELLKSVEDSMDDAIFYKDLEHRYIGCNKKFAEFIGLKEEDIIGKTDFDFFDYETALEYYKVNEELLHTKTKVVYKHWVKYEDQDIYALTSKTPLINNSGRVIGIVGISRDITHEYEMQQDLENKNLMLIEQNKLAAMGEMLANIAHQWRQPLNNLSLIIQKMGLQYKAGMLEDSLVDKNIAEAMLLMQEMSETIDDFRHFFNPRKRMENFDVGLTVYKAYSIFKSALVEYNIEFKISSPETLYIYGYKNEFFQVLLNILNNAKDALLADRVKAARICIEILKQKELVVLHIFDNANGISSRFLNKIFDPYYTTKPDGTGLGLYMSKTIIEEHMGGSIEVQSGYLGTLFILKLRGGILY